ncbi:MAG: arsenite methyltransferase [Candidatus Zixiibacteriota bacterium]|nr:MAG: arsenite methyltransferase [candidate division Zixibacteria bacterium]
MKKSEDDIKKAVKEHYRRSVTPKTSCCGAHGESSPAPTGDRITEAAGYTAGDRAGLPDGIPSFGCGNPVAFANVGEGDVVLDLGSGPGLDLILAARKVGPQGKVIGIDMTPEMVEASRKNLEKAEVKNAEVRVGEMEDMPVADGEVDWIISNCVINLSPDKGKVFAEAYRVLKPGGRMIISDLVTKDLPAEVRSDMRAWVGCIAGALEEEEFVRLVRQAGFKDVAILAKSVFGETSSELSVIDSCCCGSGTDTCEQPGGDLSGKVASILLHARKPA